MAKIILLSDSSAQLEGQHQAKNLFYSDYFRKAYEYASLLNSTKIYIVTAKYGLVSQHECICNYNNSEIYFEKSNVLTNLNIITGLIKKTNLIEDEFILLTNDRHNKILIPWLSNYYCPFQGVKRKRRIEVIKNYIFEEKMRQRKLKILECI